MLLFVFYQRLTNVQVKTSLQSLWSYNRHFSVDSSSWIYQTTDVTRDIVISFFTHTEMCLSQFPSYSGAPCQLVAVSCWCQTSAFRHFDMIVTCRPGRVVRSVETLGPRRTCRTLRVGPAEGWTSASAAEKHTHRPHYLIPNERRLKITQVCWAEHFPLNWV